MESGVEGDEEDGTKYVDNTTENTHEIWKLKPKHQSAEESVNAAHTCSHVRKRVGVQLEKVKSLLWLPRHVSIIIKIEICLSFFWQC